jgi:hypothetical protein
MGSVIPMPAFPICMTAILSVKLGNRYGISIFAQESAIAMLKSITHDRWVYFFNQCFQTNDRLLYKLVLSNPSSRWLDLFSSSFIDNILPELKERDVINLLKFTRDNKQDKLNRIANEMYSKIGYSNK